jgi:uncharacterized membrane protein
LNHSNRNRHPSSGAKLAGLIVLLTARGAEIIALLVASALGFAAEAIGVRFGLPFGD